MALKMRQRQQKTYLLCVNHHLEAQYRLLDLRHQHPPPRLCISAAPDGFALLLGARVPDLINGDVKVMGRPRVQVLQCKFYNP